ncbi:MAG: hypothetical protein JST93_35180 [Acidobacteria bacterium]|nr:hypothetical protein [Acidobacteriota bacterium]
MEKIDPKEYQKRIERLSDILTGIAQRADEVSMQRCPYKNRFSQCTANFGCRNKRKPAAEGELHRCAGDDKLDYRKAWE